MTETDDLWNTYNLLYADREVRVTAIADASTVEEATNGVNSLVELDGQIKIVLREINTLNPPIFGTPQLGKKVVTKKSVGRPKTVKK